MSSLIRFSRNLVNISKSLGWNTTNPVTFRLMGASNFNPYVRGANIRMCYSSISEPSTYLRVSDTPLIWFNPVTLEIKKSNNWKGLTGWESVNSVEEIFIENIAVSTINNSGFNNGVAQVPVVLQGEPSLPNEAANKQYVDVSIATIVSGGVGVMYGPPVQNIAQLKALDVFSIPDKHLRLVEDERTIYAYDDTSVSIADDKYIIQPLSGSGRWHATNPKIIDGGEI